MTDRSNEPALSRSDGGGVSWHQRWVVLPGAHGNRTSIRGLVGAVAALVVLTVLGVGLPNGRHTPVLSRFRSCLSPVSSP